MIHSSSVTFPHYTSSSFTFPHYTSSSATFPHYTSSSATFPHFASSSISSVYFAGSAVRPSTTGGAPLHDHNHHNNSSGLVNYYFIFIALGVAVLGAIVFLLVRRRRRAVLRRRYGENVVLTRDLGGPRPGGGWANWKPERKTSTSKVEGLDEQGNAPPPYMPKTDAEEGQSNEVAMPMRTLSRDGTGLKLPGYSARALD